MQKKLIALAALASFAGVASAQSSVTLWGVVDATVQIGRGSIADKTQLGNSGLASTQLGFRGMEDLGGGLSASFWLEMGINNDNGTGAATNTNNQASGGALAGLAGGQGLTFNRRSTVSLHGGWGELRIGRDYNPQYRSMAIFDPFGNNGVASGQTISSIVTGVTSVRSSNSIGYLFNSNLSGYMAAGDGGVYGQAMYYLGENVSGAANSKDGTGWGARLGWARGPFNTAVAYGRTKYNTVGGSGVAGTVGDVVQRNIGATYNFGMATAIAEYSSDRNGTLEGKGHVLGVRVPVGPGEIRASHSRYRTNAATNPTVTKVGLGYVHNLSKRTALYATAAHVSNDGTSAFSLLGSTTAPGGSSNGYEFGLKHSF